MGPETLGLSKTTKKASVRVTATADPGTEASNCAQLEEIVFSCASLTHDDLHDREI